MFGCGEKLCCLFENRIRLVLRVRFNSSASLIRLSCLGSPPCVHRGAEECDGSLSSNCAKAIHHFHASGRTILEHWEIHGADTHGRGDTDPRGPDAARETLRFFLEHSIANYCLQDWSPMAI